MLDNERCFIDNPKIGRIRSHVPPRSSRDRLVGPVVFIFPLPVLHLLSFIRDEVSFEDSFETFAEAVLSQRWLSTKKRRYGTLTSLLFARKNRQRSDREQRDVKCDGLAHKGPRPNDREGRSLLSRHIRLSLLSIVQIALGVRRYEVRDRHS